MVIVVICVVSVLYLVLNTVVISFNVNYRCRDKHVFCSVSGAGPPVMRRLIRVDVCEFLICRRFVI